MDTVAFSEHTNESLLRWQKFHLLISGAADVFEYEMQAWGSSSVISEWKSHFATN